MAEYLNTIGTFFILALPFCLGMLSVELFYHHAYYKRGESYMITMNTLDNTSFHMRIGTALFGIVFVFLYFMIRKSERGLSIFFDATSSLQTYFIYFISVYVCGLIVGFYSKRFGFCIKKVLAICLILPFVFLFMNPASVDVLGCCFFLYSSIFFFVCFMF